MKTSEALTIIGELYNNSPFSVRTALEHLIPKLNVKIKDINNEKIQANSIRFLNIILKYRQDRAAVDECIDWVKNVKIVSQEDRETIDEIINYFNCESRDNPGRKSIHDKWIGCLKKLKENAVHTEVVTHRFKINDWIASDILKTAKIIAINETKYTLELTDGSINLVDIDYVDNNYHLWSIEDAHYGDILASSDSEGDWIGIFKEKTNDSFSTSCFLSRTSEFVPFGGKSHFIGDTYPATKKQRDILIEKMKEFNIDNYENNNR